MRYLQTSAEGAPGISGGPLLNRGNQVVGLIFGGDRNTFDTYAIPVTDVVRAMETRSRTEVDLGGACGFSPPDR